MKRILLISLLLLSVIVSVSADRRRLLGARNVASAAAPSPSLWIVASNSSNIVPNGNVTNVTDISGNGHTFTYYNATPSYTSNAVNGLPALTFGTGTYLTNATFPSVLTGSDAPFTAFIVAQKGGPAGTIFQMGSTSDADTSHAISGEFSNWRVWRRDDAGTLADINTGTFNTSWWLFSVVFDGTTVSMYTNSTAVFTAQSQNVGTLTLNVAVIGGRNLGGTLSSVFDGGKIAEIKIFNSSLSGGDRATEETSLKTKYGF